VAASRAWHRIWSAYDPDDEVAFPESAVSRRLGDSAQGFMAQDQPVTSFGRTPVFPADDLLIGAADADSQAVDQ
jgi:hypothetical protein